MHKYRLVSKKGEGTFSEVLKAQSVVSGEYFAVKCMKNHFKSLEQVNSLREIQALRRLNENSGIITLEEVLFDEVSGRLALVFELMDMNIYEMIRGRKQYVKPAIVKRLMFQLIKAVKHMHDNGIFHRDIKPENILVEKDSYNLKVADFGSCRGIYTKMPFTEYISTRWYRAPECLLTNGYYDYKMDMWGIGCVMFEVVSLFPLFPGTNELDQIEKVHAILGTPSKEVLKVFKKEQSYQLNSNNYDFPPQEGTGIPRLIPHADPDCVDIIKLMLAYNPEDRITASKALRHAYFKDLVDAERRGQTAAAKVESGQIPASLSSIMSKDNKKKDKEKKDRDKDKEKKLPMIKSKDKKKKNKTKIRKEKVEEDDNDVGSHSISMDSDDMSALGDEDEVAEPLSDAANAPSPEKPAKALAPPIKAPSISKPKKAAKEKKKKVPNMNASTSNLPSIVINTNSGTNSSTNNNSNSTTGASPLSITSYNKKPKKKVKRNAKVPTSRYKR